MFLAKLTAYGQDSIPNSRHTGTIQYRFIRMFRDNAAMLKPHVLGQGTYERCCVIYTKHPYSLSDMIVVEMTIGK